MIKPLHSGKLLYNAMLAEYTTWRVGGIAKLLYRPVDLNDLIMFMQQINKQESVIWLGLGSNCLIRDSGFLGAVIITQGGLQKITLLNDNLVRVEAGVSCATMARFCARNALSGAEFWAGIPGTMGGALRMNAGCYGGETWSTVVNVETLDINGIYHIKTPNDFSVSYRHVDLPINEWFVAGTFKLSKGDKNIALNKIKECLDHRAKTQPTSEYNCGSVFTNPSNDFAARLIESCGLKGMQIGHAEVSTKHANFIINKDGMASSNDIEKLIEYVQDIVYKQTAIKLKREIHIIGNV